MEEKKIQSASEKDLKKIINGMIKKALNDNRTYFKKLFFFFQITKFINFFSFQIFVKNIY